MPFEAAKCPNCGGILQLDDSNETGFCQFCGSRIVVRDAIQKMKIEVSGQVSMSGISSVENDIKRGQQCLAVKDWKKALEALGLLKSYGARKRVLLFCFITAKYKEYL